MHSFPCQWRNWCKINSFWIQFFTLWYYIYFRDYIKRLTKLLQCICHFQNLNFANSMYTKRCVNALYKLSLKNSNFEEKKNIKNINSDIYSMLKIRHFESFIFVNVDSSEPLHICLYNIYCDNLIQQFNIKNIYIYVFYIKLLNKIITIYIYIFIQYHVIHIFLIIIFKEKIVGWQFSNFCKCCKCEYRSWQIF